MTKHKKILLVSIFSLTLIVGMSMLWQRYEQLKPIAEHAGPAIAFTPDGHTVTAPVTHTSQASSTAQQTTTSTTTPPAPQRTDNAPKQTAIRETVTKEHVYYPLMSANDPGYTTDWALQKVNAPAAWDITTGNGQTVVADIDTGFALNHEDLKNSWYINPGESGTTQIGDRCWTGAPQDKSANNCDDDNNGYVDDWRGWNFYMGDNNPTAGRVDPTGVAVGHGTETAGLIGAGGNNNTGITTINWNTKIMPLQVLSDDGPGYTSDVVAAIYYAVDNGAQVINMSLGGSTYDATLTEATDYAYAHNVVVVAAAGNCGTGTEDGCTSTPAGAMGYPALNDHVIAVGATTSSDERASFSSYGPALDVVAPGAGTIYSPTWTASDDTNLYASSLYGTSFASPQVASLVSLIKAIRPSSSVNDITGLILGTATKLPVMNGQNYSDELGHGVINAGAALTVASSLNATSAQPELLQAGGYQSEHQFSSSEPLGSGCKVTAGSYCAIWLRDDRTGYERYLPYQKAGSTSPLGWSWNSSLLTSGQWQVHAMQGDYHSPIYFLDQK